MSYEAVGWSQADVLSGGEAGAGMSCTLEIGLIIAKNAFEIKIGRDSTKINKNKCTSSMKFNKENDMISLRSKSNKSIKWIIYVLSANIVVFTSLIQHENAYASGGYAPPPPPPAEKRRGQSASPGAETLPGNSTEKPGEKAAGLYASAYQDVQDGKEALHKGKEKSARKKFESALEACREVLEMDSTHYQAWNLVGFCSRKLGRTDTAFVAYARCLKLKPDFEVAHEYRGEAYLQVGDLKNAEVELDWLERRASEWASDLKSAILAYRAAHPDTTAAPGSQ